MRNLIVLIAAILGFMFILGGCNSNAKKAPEKAIVAIVPDSALSLYGEPTYKMGSIYSRKGWSKFTDLGNGIFRKAGKLEVKIPLLLKSPFHSM